jgi:hypothetical protein
MTSEQYWKIKTAVLERRLLEQQAQTAIQAAALKIGQALAAAGLDPTGTYEMHDESETCTPYVAKEGDEVEGPTLAVDNS